MQQLGDPDFATREAAAFAKSKTWLADQKPKPAAPPGYVVDIQFSPDGKHMVMVAGGKVTLSVADLRAWQTGFGPVVLTTAGDGAGFSADGKTLFVMGPKAVTVHDAATGKETKSFPRPKTKWGWNLVSFSPDGTRYAAHFGLFAGVYDVATGFEPVRLDKQYEMAAYITGSTGRQLLWSPDGKQVVAVGVLVNEGAKGAAVWDAGTGKRLHAFEANSTDGPRALAFSSDSKQIAVGFAKHVSTFDAATFKEVKNLGDTPGSGPVTALAFSPDGKLLAVGFRLPMIHGGEKVPRVIGHKTEVQLLDLATGKELKRFDGFEGVNHMGATELPVSVLAFSPDGKKLAAGTGIPALTPIPPDNAPKTGEVKVFNTDPAVAPKPAAPFLVLTVRGLDDSRSPYTLTEFDASGKVLWSVTPGADVAEKPKLGATLIDLKNRETQQAVIAAAREYLTRVKKDPNAPRDLRVLFDNDAQIGGFSIEALKCCQEAGFEKIQFTGYIPFGGFIPLLKPGADGEAEGYKRYKGEVVDTKKLLTDYAEALRSF